MRLTLRLIINVIAIIFLILSIGISSYLFIDIYKQLGERNVVINNYPAEEISKEEQSSGGLDNSSLNNIDTSATGNSYDDVIVSYSAVGDSGNLLSNFLTWINSTQVSINPETYFREDAEFLKDLNIGGSATIEEDLNVGGELNVEGGATFEDKVTINEELIVNGIGLSDNTSLLSGASLVGLYDNNYVNISGNTTVQGAIGELDAAVASATHNPVTLAAGLNYLTLNNQEITMNQIDITTDVLGATLSVAELNLLDNSTVTNGGLVFGNGTNLTQDTANLFWDNGTNSLGIGTTSPVSILSVGGSSQFQVNSTGNIVKLNGVTTSFPSSQGAAGSLLTNDGAGTLTWAAPSGTGTLGYWQRNGTSLAPANIGDNVGIGTTAPIFRLELSGSAISDRKLGINGTQTMYLPDQAINPGSLIIGNSGANFTAGSDWNTLVGIDAGNGLDAGWGNTVMGFNSGNSLDNTNAAVVIGYNNLAGVSTNFGESVIIGSNIGSGGGFTTSGAGESVIVGSYAAYNLDNAFGSVFLGRGAGAGSGGASNVNYNIAVGYAALNDIDDGASSNIAIGENAGYSIIGGLTGDHNIFIGTSSNVSTGEIGNSIVIGRNAQSTASNQLVIGSGTLGAGAITEGYIGSGVTSATPNDITINATGGSGTNIAGANFTLAGGKGTGSGDGGDLIFKTADVLGTGTTLQSLTEKMRLTDEGNLGIGTTAPSYKLDVIGSVNSYGLISHNLSLSGALTSILTALKGFDGYTNFTGGIGTGGNGKDSITGAQRLTSSGNLVNIGSIQAGEVNITRGGTFLAKADYGAGANPYSVDVGDVNGDGKADLAVANSSSNTVSVFINDGDGTFAVKADYGTGLAPVFVTIGDVNGDGWADLAASNYNSNSVSVLINNGNGTFATKVDYATGLVPLDITFGDVNGDGKADMAVTNANSGTVSVFINNGNGTFAAKADYSVDFGVQGLAIADVNGDGKADLAAGNRNSSAVSVLINNGNGTFAAKVDYTTGTNPYSVVLGDVNGDGMADLASANWGANSISVLINNGNGTFVAKVDYTTGLGPVSVAIIDMNGDGKADLASANAGAASASVFINNGDGTFAAKADYATGSSPYSIAAGDVNDDGKADLAAANYGAASVSVLINNVSPVLYASATTGNVGIGTTASAFTLDVAGSIGPSADDTYDLGSDVKRFRDLYLGPATLHIGTSISDEYTIGYDTGNNTLGFNVNGSGNPEIVFDTSGNIGIGTTAPAYKFDANVSGSYDGMRVTNSNGDDLLRYYTSGTSRFGVLTMSNAGVSNVRLSSDTGISSYINSGNVGIGTTEPGAYKLYVDQTNINTPVAFFNKAPGANLYAVEIDAGNGNDFRSWGLKIAAGANSVSNASDNRLIDFSSGDNTTVGSIGWANSNLVINALSNIILNNTGGNVGIGTASSGAKLYVAGSVGIAADAYFDGSRTALITGGDSPALYSTANNSGAYPFDGTSWNNLVIQARSTAAKDIVFVTGTTPAVRVVINGAGNVGMGTASPGTHRLSVVGTAGLSTGTAWTNTSDSRFKDVQSELYGSALEKIKQLRPVTYNWNELHDSRYGEDPGLNYGFIAQEVAEVIPEMISRDTEGYYYYNPSGFEAILTGAIQEQQIMIDVNTSSISSISTLGNRIEELENKLEMVTSDPIFNSDLVVQKDLPESYSTKDSTLEIGDVVVIDTPVQESSSSADLSKYMVAKSDSDNKDKVLGIVSGKSEEHVNVALAGRVPVKYETVNGEIKAGDLLAVSTEESGKVMKATEEGWVLGRALEDSREDSETIMMTVNLTWYTGDAETLAFDTSIPVNIEELKAGLEQILEIQDTDEGGKRAVFFSDMNVMGDVTASSLNTLGQITVGFLTIDGTDDFISVLGGGDLKLQNGINPGNIDAFNGALVLTADGGIIAKGDISAKTVSAETVLSKTVTSNNFTIQGTNDATQDSSIGEGIISAGTTQVVIPNLNVNSGSKIFVTPTTNVRDNSLVVSDKGDGSFTVTIWKAFSEDIKFDYWILGVEEASQ